MRVCTYVNTVVCVRAGGYGSEAREASSRAAEAQTRAEAAESRVQVIVDQLPDDQTRVNQIPRDIDDARKDMRDAHSQVSIKSIAQATHSVYLLVALVQSIPAVNLHLHAMLGLVNVGIGSVDDDFCSVHNRTMECLEQLQVVCMCALSSRCPVYFRSFSLGN